MSAFVVGADHIDAMLTAALAADHDFSWWTGTDRARLTRANVSEVGAMLVRENVASVSYRYGGEATDTLPGPIDKGFVDSYVYRATPTIPTVHGLSLVSCYEYQTCEHPTWKASSAHGFCDSLRRALIRNLPGYGEAPWEYTRPE